MVVLPVTLGIWVAKHLWNHREGKARFSLDLKRNFWLELVCNLNLVDWDKFWYWLADFCRRGWGVDRLAQLWVIEVRSLIGDRVWWYLSSVVYQYSFLKFRSLAFRWRDNTVYSLGHCRAFLLYNLTENTFVLRWIRLEAFVVHVCKGEVGHNIVDYKLESEHYSQKFDVHQFSLTIISGEVNPGVFCH